MALARWKTPIYEHYRIERRSSDARRCETYLIRRETRLIVKIFEIFRFFTVGGVHGSVRVELKG